MPVITVQLGQCGNQVSLNKSNIKMKQQQDQLQWQRTADLLCDSHCSPAAGSCLVRYIGRGAV
jgi:hypothetical protein